jgi:hypothetical protein
MAHVDHLLTALGFFKDWSNYLLVTTVAAIGWTASDKAKLVRSWRTTCIWLLTLSVIAGIFTLAAIPLVAEALDGSVKPDAVDASFYDVMATFHLFWFFGPELSIKLKWVCWPQHLLFIFGMLAYAVGATQNQSAINNASD